MTNYVDKKFDAVLQRVDSRLLSKLWLFYRDYFGDDDSCLDFFYRAVRQEPICSGKDLKEELLNGTSDNNFVDSNNQLFIPRRMLNCVERMVSTARDMEQIRRGKDVFKVVFLVTCAETLQKLSRNVGKKKELLFNFFTRYTSDADKKYICDHFLYVSDNTPPPVDVSFWRFISVINEYRNCATHESDYWDICFNNENGEDKTPILVSVDAQLTKKPTKTHDFYRSTLSYHEFERIFVRTCIRFIQSYIDKQEDNSSS